MNIKTEHNTQYCVGVAGVEVLSSKSCVEYIGRTHAEPCRCRDYCARSDTGIFDMKVLGIEIVMLSSLTLYGMMYKHHFRKEIEYCIVHKDYGFLLMPLENCDEYFLEWRELDVD